MKFQWIMLAILAVFGCSSQAAPDSTNSVSTERVLIIDSSSMPVAAGKATLTIGPLKRVNGVYTGNYTVKLFPYFFKNEKGTLAIVVSDESLAMINLGKEAKVSGTATTSGKHGVSRHVDATATPGDLDCGRIKLWFTAGKRVMTFEPTYHFAEKQVAAVPAQGIAGN